MENEVSAKCIRSTLEEEERKARELERQIEAPVDRMSTLRQKRRRTYK